MPSEGRLSMDANRPGTVSEMMNRGYPRSGQAIRAKRGIPQGGRRPLWRLVHRRLSEPRSSDSRTGSTIRISTDNNNLNFTNMKTKASAKL
ncbi:Uncharacterised protein [Yersinia frederiksenii]|nr:Uncharacterised protein [Yersinia frederiksenii]